MSVKTALRVIEIIETFAREKRALPLSELARLLDVPVSSCLALIRTLTGLGYLYETGRRQGYYPSALRVPTPFWTASIPAWRNCGTPPAKPWFSPS
jgi:hypothetical protein